MVTLRANNPTRAGGKEAEGKEAGGKEAGNFRGARPLRGELEAKVGAKQGAKLGAKLGATKAGAKLGATVTSGAPDHCVILFCRGKNPYS